MAGLGPVALAQPENHFASPARRHGEQVRNRHPAHACADAAEGGVARALGLRPTGERLPARRPPPVTPLAFGGETGRQGQHVAPSRRHRALAGLRAFGERKHNSGCPRGLGRIAHSGRQHVYAARPDRRPEHLRRQRHRARRRRDRHRGNRVHRQRAGGRRSALKNKPHLSPVLLDCPVGCHRRRSRVWRADDVGAVLCQSAARCQSHGCHDCPHLPVHDELPSSPCAETFRPGDYATCRSGECTTFSP